jgi:hypothetical protein
MIKIFKKYIPSHFKRAIREMLGKKPGGRSLTVYNTDVFIVSYPKSGNTWTRFLIGNLIYEEGVDFANIEQRVPDIYINTDSNLRDLPTPRILKSHEYFDPRYKKVIYIVRDPRDVVISYWHFAKKQNLISEQLALDTFVNTFLKGGVDGYGSWGENVGSWLGARKGDKDFLLLRYEDMLNDPENVLSNISDFLGLDSDSVRIKRAIELSTFDRMKQLETIQSGEWDATRKSRRDMPFMRSGKTGEWRNSVSDSAIKLIQDEWADHMELVGYLPQHQLK